jgi:hypothetical protein
MGKFDPKKLIVESTLAPLDQLSKTVDENYSTAGLLSEKLKVPNHSDVKVRYTINMYPYKPGLLRIQWHTEFSVEKGNLTFINDLKPEAVVEKLEAALDPWSSRVKHESIKTEVKIIKQTPTKAHVGVFMCLKSDTDPDKFHPDDKDACVRVQHIVFKIATENVWSFFFEEMIPLEDGPTSA